MRIVLLTSTLNTPTTTESFVASAAAENPAVLGKMTELTNQYLKTTKHMDRDGRMNVKLVDKTQTNRSGVPEESDLHSTEHLVAQ